MMSFCEICSTTRADQLSSQEAFHHTGKLRVAPVAFQHASKRSRVRHMSTAAQEGNVELCLLAEPISLCQKCDLAQPACSRCSRLRINCTGSGQTRYLFRFDSRSSIPGEKSRSLEEVVSGISTSIVYTPDNDTTRLQRALIARLRPALDPRYSILIRWGYFLVGAPRRLGSNKALDAAVNALLARHTQLSLRQNDSNSQIPVALYYSKALSALRVNLQDEQTATTTETLFAVILLMYCQVRC